MLAQWQRRLDTALRPLINNFGFASNCFVCDPNNAEGLRIPFVRDDDDGVVRAVATLAEQHSGAPALVHGGVLAALCDDAVAWAAIAFGRRFALVAEMRLNYLLPVPIERELTVTGRLIGQHRTQMWLLAEIRIDGAVHVRADARATAMGAELAAGAGVTAPAVG